MLPYTEFEFFIVAGILTLVTWLFRLTGRAVKLSPVLMSVSLVYLIFFFPYPWHVATIILYSYLVYYLFSFVFRLNNKLIGSIVLLLPMILVKSDIRFHFYPFHLNDLISFAGLSFMSFRILHIYLDVQEGDKPVSFFKYLNFLIFYPTLLIGPIDRFPRFQADVDRGFEGFTKNNLIQGLNLIILGALYKYMIAEAIDRFYLSGLDPTDQRLWPMLNSMYTYHVYLFFDFAGYSHMAVGLGILNGIRVPANFNMPFLAENPQDFWRRYHISLGEWLKDFFFRPFYLFLSKRPSLKTWPLLRQNVALFMTFALMGFWNGFQKHYIISGMIFGLYSVVHNSYLHYCKKKRKDVVFARLPQKYVKVISIFIMINLAAFAVYVFSGRFPYL
jgi:membrane protein involved in D-alanine export